MGKLNSGITVNLPPIDGITANGGKPLPSFNPNENAFPSIELYPTPGRWECAGLRGLVLTPAITLAVCFLFRTGRDLSLPFLIVQLLVLVLGIVLAVKGWRQRDALHLSVGCLCGTLALGFGMCGMLTMMGCILKEYTISITAKDALTGMPVPNADVMLYWTREHTCSAKTDQNGECKIAFAFLGDSMHSLVCDVGGVSFRRVRLEADADGYAPVRTRLGEVLAPAWSIHDPPPPPIEIRLIPTH